MNRASPGWRSCTYLHVLPLLASTLLSCSSDQSSPSKLEIDLANESRAAVTWHSTESIDFGSVTSRPHLVEGWSSHVSGPGKMQVTQVAREADLVFSLLEPVRLPVTFRAESLADTDIEVEIGLNGQRWALATFSKTEDTWEGVLPEDLLRSHDNRLTLRVSAPASPRQIRWQEIRFSGAGVSGVEVDLSEDRFFLPYGSGVDFFLEVSEVARFVADDLEIRGQGRLSLDWSPLEGEATQLSVEESGDVVSFRLSRPEALQSETRMGRLSLRAIGRGFPDRGIVLKRPRVLGRTPIDEEAPSPIRSGPASSAPNILIYMVDTLRADHLGCYGYEKDISPNIDRLARENVLFSRAQANAPWTRPSIATLFTGLHPLVHGVNTKMDTLPEEVTTLAETLAASGYRTGAVVGNANVVEPLGFAQGFEFFEFLINVAPGRQLASAADVHATALDWLTEDSERPFFLYLHTIDPHAPYFPPPQVADVLAPGLDVERVGSIRFLDQIKRDPALLEKHLGDIVALYDAEIAYLDGEFGKFRAELENRGQYSNTLLVLLSDHGEEFFDHGDWLHGKTLYGEMLNTPLILKMPDGEAGQRVVRHLVRHTDILPTILDRLGLSSHGVSQGRSLLPLLADAPTPQKDRAVAFLDLNSTATSVIDGHWKLIQARDEHGEFFPELYDLTRDPVEKNNLAGRHLLRARYMSSVRRRIESQTTRLDPGVADDSHLENPDIRENLEALGYL